MRSFMTGLTATVLCAVALAASADDHRTVVYENDFEGEQPVGKEWSAPPILTEEQERRLRQNPNDPQLANPGSSIPPVTKAPRDDEHFLGEFNNHSVRLTLSDLPDHNRLRIAFNFIPIKSWDGSTSVIPGTTNKIGPDQFSVKLTGDRTLFSGTFCNHLDHGEGWQQTFPGVLPQDVNVAGAGRVAADVFGYNGPAETTDAVYYLDMTIPHTANVVQLVFAAEGLQGINDESWAIDNVRVEVFNIEDEPTLDRPVLVLSPSKPRTEPTGMQGALPRFMQPAPEPEPVIDPALLDEDGQPITLFDQVWADLKGTDGMAAYSAVWTLVAEGERVLPLVKSALAEDPEADQSELKRQIEQLAADLDSEDYYKARDARKELATLGPEAVPIVREHLKTVKTQAARVYLAKMMTETPTDPLADPIKRRRARLIYALRMMDSEAAEKLIEQIEE